MHPVGALIAMSFALVLVLAGCLQTPDLDDEADDESADAQDGSGDPQGAQNTPADTPTDEDGQEDNNDNGEGDGGGEDNETGDGDGDNNETDETCHEDDPPKPAHPDNHEVGSTSDLRCPGNYVILDGGSGNTWNAPTWEEGDWWYYEMEALNGQTMNMQCAFRYKETVMEINTSKDVPVYQLKKEIFDCDGEPAKNSNGEPAEPQWINRTKESFMQLYSDGFIQHELIFPLVDDKKWKFRNQAKADDRRIVDANLAHQSNFVFDGASHEAWRVNLEWASVERTIWWGVEEQHMLRDEIWSGAILAARTDLLDHSGDDDSGLLPTRG